MLRMGLRLWKVCSVIKYLVSKGRGLTLSQGTALDNNTLIKGSIAYFETQNLRP